MEDRILGRIAAAFREGGQVKPDPLSGKALVTAAKAAVRLRDQISPDGGMPEVDGFLCEDGETVMLTVHCIGKTLTHNVLLTDLGGTAVADFAANVERSLKRPRRPTLKLSAS